MVSIIAYSLALISVVMMSVHDWRARIIPDVWLFPFFICGLIIGDIPWIRGGFYESAMAAALGYAIGFLINIVFKRVKKYQIDRSHPSHAKASKMLASLSRPNHGAGQTSSHVSCVTPYDPIGMGDVKLLAAGGFWLGFDGLAVAVCGACLFGFIWAKVRKQKYVPFAPFFFAGMALFIVGWVVF